MPPCTISGARAVTGRAEHPVKPGTPDRPGAPACEQREGGPAWRFMAASGPLCTEHVSDLSEPNSGMEDPTRGREKGPGPEAEPRFAGIRWGRARCFSPGSAHRSSALVPVAFQLWRCVHDLSGGLGPLLAALAETRLSAQSWLSQSQKRDGENGCPGRSLSGFSQCPGRELPGCQTWDLKTGSFKPQIWPGLSERATEASERSGPASPRSWHSVGTYVPTGKGGLGRWVEVTEVS